MKEYQFITRNEGETERLASALAKNICNESVILLSGDLGAGKSVFARAFIRSLCGQDTAVPSPTFSIVQQYESSDYTIFHYDLYRLEHEDELVEIGFEDSLGNGICIIEWPEIAKPYLDGKNIEISVRISEKEVRNFTFSCNNVTLDKGFLNLVGDLL